MNWPPLEPPVTHHVLAVLGWIELGNPAEAATELAQVPAALMDHPDVLEVRWQLGARRAEWAACAGFGAALVEALPDRPFGWIHRSFALHEMRRTQQARDLLVPAVSRFPKEWVIRYNLACYACQLGRLEEARDWLDQAVRIGERSRILAMAREDRDLAPLWKGLRPGAD